MKKTCKACGVAKNANKSKSSQFSTKGKRYRTNCKTCENTKKKHDRSAAKKLGVQRELDAIGRNPHGFLAAGIIELAIREHRNWKDGGRKRTTDYGDARAVARQKGYANPIEEIEAFFASDWFDELAGFAGCDPEYLRKHIYAN